MRKISWVVLVAAGLVWAGCSEQSSTSAGGLWSFNGSNWEASKASLQGQWPETLARNETSLSDGGLLPRIEVNLRVVAAPLEEKLPLTPNGILTRGDAERWLRRCGPDSIRHEAQVTLRTGAAVTAKSLQETRLVTAYDLSQDPQGQVRPRPQESVLLVGLTSDLAAQVTDDGDVRITGMKTTVSRLLDPAARKGKILLPDDRQEELIWHEPIMLLAEGQFGAAQSATLGPDRVAMVPLSYRLLPCPPSPLRLMVLPGSVQSPHVVEGTGRQEQPPARVRMVLLIEARTLSSDVISPEE